MKRKMGKNVIMTISYKEDKDPIMVELDVIAARERKSRSELIVSLIEQYVQNHSSGNDSFKLDIWQEDPDFKAVPTILSPSEKWFSYLGNCDNEEMTRIAISATSIMKQIRHFRDQVK